jgi:hypothetical protein
MRTSSRFTGDDNGYRNRSNYDDDDNRSSGRRRGSSNREYAAR